jgi:hypothetical protein
MVGNIIHKYYNTVIMRKWGYIMSVLVTIAVRPSNGLKPYVLIGSDSKRVNSTVDYTDDLEPIYNICSIEEDSKKIFKISNMLIGMAGHFNVLLTDKLLMFLEEQEEKNTEINDLFMKTYNFIQNEVYSDNDIINGRCVVTIAACQNNIPKIVYIAADKINPSESCYFIKELNEGEFIPIFTGNSKNLDDLKEKFIYQINNCINYNLPSVKRTVIEYLKSAAARHPETCNQNITIKISR